MQSAIIRGALRSLLLLILAPTAYILAGFSTQGTQLLDTNGVPFIMRGVNYPHTWFTGNTAASIPHIAATGANAVRIVLSNGERWNYTSESEVAGLIQLCKDNGLIPILEVHDTTGYDEQSGSVPLSTATAYWLGIQNALIGQEDYVIINLGNEPLGNGWPASEWVNIHTDAIGALRAAGFTHTLMVDAANWGQDWEGITLANAPTVAISDPLSNIVFSVHMYDVYDNAAIIDNYLSTFVGYNLPLVVGEFAADHGRRKDVDEASILALCESYGYGYLGWSWSGNGRTLSSLDIVENFDPTQLTPWGDTLINSANGIAATSVPATVFGAVDTLNVSPSSLFFASSADTDTISVTSNLSWSASDDQIWMTVSPSNGNGNGSVFVSVDENTGSAGRSGTVTISGGGLTREVAVSQDGVSATLDIFVADIVMSFSKQGPNYQAIATVTITDESGASVSGATVEGAWSGATTGNAVASTDSSGQATFTSSKVRNGGTFTFTVSNVTHPTLSYQSSLNVETSDTITAP